MSGQEEKRIIVKVAYNYFQDGKWDMALSEYEKLALIDPMDFLVHNMMAEIYIRKGKSQEAVSEYLKAACLLYATNNVEKAIHAYKQILKQDPEHPEAKGKVDELVKLKLQSIDSIIAAGNLEDAVRQCEKLSFRVPEYKIVDEKLEAIEKMIQKGKDVSQAIPAKKDAENEQQTNDELVSNLVLMAERYEVKKQWADAIEPYLTILRIKPDDLKTKNKLNDLYRKISQADKSGEVLARMEKEKGAMVAKAKKIINTNDTENGQPPASDVYPDPPKADLSSTYNEMEKLRLQAEERLRKSVAERREREKLQVNVNSDKTEAPPEQMVEEKEKDLQISMTQVQMYINQNMLVEALRVCQRILDIDPSNAVVRKLLKKIYDKKKLT